MPRSARAVLLVALLPLAACTAGQTVEAATTTAAPPATSSSASSSAPTDSGSSTAQSPGSPAGTSPQSGPAQAGATPDPSGQLRVQGINLSSQPGSSRLVVNLSGAGVPSWHLAYGEATGPGGGPVSIAGDAFLRLSLATGAQPGGGHSSSSVSGSGVIEAVQTTGLFEGTEEVLIGVRGGQLPFRVTALTDPGRIVIEIPAS